MVSVLATNLKDCEFLLYWKDTKTNSKWMTCHYEPTTITS